jgi:hypothetical protein
MEIERIEDNHWVYYSVEIFKIDSIKQNNILKVVHCFSQY